MKFINAQYGPIAVQAVDAHQMVGGLPQQDITPPGRDAFRHHCLDRAAVPTGIKAGGGEYRPWVKKRHGHRAPRHPRPEDQTRIFHDCAAIRMFTNRRNHAVHKCRNHGAVMDGTKTALYPARTAGRCPTDPDLMPFGSRLSWLE